MKRKPTVPRPRIPWTRTQKLVVVLVALNTILLSWLWSATNYGPEYNWLVLANLYAPQILWGIPPLLLMLLAFFARGKRLWLVALPLVPLFIVFVPLMGLRGYPAPAQPAMSDPVTSVRILTYNIEFGRKATDIFRIVAQQRPDIIVMQDVRDRFEADFRNSYPRWNVYRNGEFLVATRFPLLLSNRFELPRLLDNKWARPAYIRSVVRIGMRDIAIYTTHFGTPRRSLEALSWRADSAVSQLESSSNTRLYQGSVLSQALAGERLPCILGGDFNAPEPSLVCRQVMKAGMRDAYSEAGKGYGYTFGHAVHFGVSFLRIDHLYVSSHWAVQACYPGDKAGSDHRPVIAELTLKK